MLHAGAWSGVTSIARAADGRVFLATREGVVTLEPGPDGWSERWWLPSPDAAHATCASAGEIDLLLLRATP